MIDAFWIIVFLIGYVLVWLTVIAFCLFMLYLVVRVIRSAWRG